MYNIYCLQGFNNYYNRVVKKFDKIQDYTDYQLEVGKTYEPFSNINFVPNDCVNTSQIINWPHGWLPDYMITQDQETGNIMRWFVVESVRQRGQQYLFHLRRDLIVDFYDSIIEAPCFVEKANLTYENPLIFNKEDISVNQIKSNEILLKDKSDCGWLVGYYEKGATLEGTVDVNANPESIPVNVQDITDWEYYQYRDNGMPGPETYGVYMFYYSVGLTYPTVSRAEVNKINGDTNTTGVGARTVQLSSPTHSITESELKTAFVNYGLENLNPDPYSNTKSQGKVDDLLSYDGKLIKTLDGKYYRVDVRSEQQTKTVPVPSGDLFNNLSDVIATTYLQGRPNNDTFSYKFTSMHYFVTVTEEEALATRYLISSNRLITTDAPWDIFAIPYGRVVVMDGTRQLVATSQDYAIATATAIQKQHPGKVYDVQLVPYCPVQTLITTVGKMAVSDPKEYSIIVDGEDRNIGIIFNVPKSTLKFQIATKVYPAQTAIERKLRSECNKYRLTAPNYSNYFDFNVEKNGGIPGFNVDINYKPYTPYIHINPLFGELYGYNDNSPRGLVLGGDFSLSQIVDQWQQYQIQNKNFQNIFDRQIQNLELNQSVQRTQDIVKAITGTATGATSGAFTGGLMGGGWGAAAGAAVGGIASLAGGLADYELNERLRNETLDYTKDMFGYQLANIQALPTTISKVSVLNNNNKIFPVLEYYTCTNTERIAVLNKLAFNGMTVMTIGKIKNYLGNTWSYSINDDINGEQVTITSRNYIKGRLIKIEDINCDDFHVANEIANEVFKGVYL